MRCWGLPPLRSPCYQGLALNLAGGRSPQGNMPGDVYWLLTVELQSPQHMLPHLWRMPQWLAAGCYLALAALAVFGPNRWSQPGQAEALNRTIRPTRWSPTLLRLVATLAVILVGLGMAWYAIEYWHHVGITVFQPFRMATLARGITLVFVAGRITALWRMGGLKERLRAILIVVALTGDWLMVVVTLAELSVAAAGATRAYCSWCREYRFIDLLAWSTMLAPRCQLSDAPRHGIWPPSAHGRSWDGFALGVVGKVGEKHANP